MLPASPPAYDLAPSLGLLALAAALALGPLAWVLWRARRSGASALHMLRVLTLWLTFDLIVFGAFTRLTDSGLGCPDWPGCYASAGPLAAREAITQAQALWPDGPVTWFKAWVEMLHRYLAMTVGALIVAQVALAWRARSQPQAGLGWALGALVWVLGQGAFGALTVSMKLFPAIVSLHWLGALGLWLLLWTPLWRASPAQATRYWPALHALSPQQRRLGLWGGGLALALVLGQLSLGAWVSTNYAVLACPDFPTCQGRWWPAQDWPHALQIWRALGHTADGALLPFSALVSIHFMHRLGACAVALGVGGWALALNAHAAWRPAARLLAALLGLQWASGMANVILGWPLASALLHSAGAAGLLAVCMGITLRAARAGGNGPARAQPAQGFNRGQPVGGRRQAIEELV